jgi:hypothetical protein
MLKIMLAFLLYLFPYFIHASEHIGALGIEGGVARLSDGSNSAYGPSGMFHFEYQIDPIVGFFGQAGRSDATNDHQRFTQTTFNGGLLLDVLPVLEFRLGIATTILEVKDANSTKKENELGPLAGATIYIKNGIWKMGASGTVIRTGSLQSAALRLVLLMMF